MAFKVGEYVTSKERPELGKGKIIDEVDFNQYIVKFAGGDESLFEGSDLVAANACAKNAKFKIGDRVKYKGKRYFVYWSGGDGNYFITESNPFYGNPVHQIPAKEEELEGKSSNSCSRNTGVRSTNAAVNAALNACAKNAERLEKRFGDVEVLAYEDGRLGIRYVITLGGFDEFVNAVSWDDAGKKCSAEARQMASLFEKRAASIKQAAAWLEANAK